MKFYIFLLQLSREIMNWKLLALQEPTEYDSVFWIGKETFSETIFNRSPFNEYLDLV